MRKKCSMLTLKINHVFHLNKTISVHNLHPQLHRGIVARIIFDLL
jgi:hypothetical protein